MRETDTERHRERDRDRDRDRENEKAESHTTSQSPNDPARRQVYLRDEVRQTGDCSVPTETTFKSNSLFPSVSLLPPGKPVRAPVLQH